MEKFDKGFTIGAVVAAVVVGGMIFALYPASFGYASGKTATSYVADGTTQTPNTATVDSSTASQKATESPPASSPSTPQPSGNSGY